MDEPIETRKEQAGSANEEEIARFLHDTSPDVIRTLLQNRNLSEDDVRILASRKNLPSDILETIARDKRWLESYPVKLSLARNPKTPLSISLSIARYLRLFDLAEMTRNHFLPLVFRHKLEMIIIEKIPTMDLGLKKTLAKLAAGEVLQKLIQNGYPEVVKLCLDNPYLVEGHLYKIINRHSTTSVVIKIIAEHPKWTTRSLIKVALVRNAHTPLALSAAFISGMSVMDLHDVYRDPSTPITIKPFIHRELLSRGENPEAIPQEKIFDIDEEDEAVIEEFKEEQQSR